MKYSFTIIAFFLLLVGCQEMKEELHFNGSSENWSAELEVSVIEASEENKLKLKYKGKDIECTESFDYILENKTSQTTYGANSVNLDKDGLYTNNDLSSNSPSTTSEDAINITINWEEHSESFVLNNAYY